MTTPSADGRASDPTPGKPRRRSGTTTPITSTPPPQRRRRPQAPPPPTEAELHPLAEGAARLGVSPRTLRRLITDGRIAVVEVTPRKRYVRQADLEAFLERATKPATK